MKKLKQKLSNMFNTKLKLSTKREVKTSSLEELYKKTFNIDSVKDLNVKLKNSK